MSSREFDVWAWRETRRGPRCAAPARDAAAVPLWAAEQKTGKRRIVGLPEHLLCDMRKIAGKKYVFEHKNDPERHRTRQAVWKDVKRAAVAFRLPQNVAPHSARKVYAVDLLAKYGDIAKVQRALNHSGPNVTMIYAMADQLYRQKYHKNPHEA